AVLPRVDGPDAQPGRVLSAVLKAEPQAEVLVSHAFEKARRDPFRGHAASQQRKLRRRYVESAEPRIGIGHDDLFAYHLDRADSVRLAAECAEADEDLAMPRGAGDGHGAELAQAQDHTRVLGEEGRELLALE